MSTPDRTTIKAAIEELTAKLRANLVADPPTAAKPFRKVEAGAAEVQAYPRPFLTVFLNRTRIDPLLLVSSTVSLDGAPAPLAAPR